MVQLDFLVLLAAGAGGVAGDDVGDADAETWLRSVDFLLSIPSVLLPFVLNFFHGLLEQFLQFSSVAEFFTVLQPARSKGASVVVQSLFEFLDKPFVPLYLFFLSLNLAHRHVGQWS